MKASELIKQLVKQISENGDKDVVWYDHFESVFDEIYFVNMSESKKFIVLSDIEL